MAQQTFNLPYREEPYQITATRQFYHSQTKSVNINPTTPNPNLSFELVRKTGEWIYTEDSEVLPYGRTVVEDINVEEEDSYISQPGVEGTSFFSEEREFIDGIWTGEIRNRTETIVDPINEIYILGTAVVTHLIDVFRTEVIPYTTEEYNSNDYYIGEEVVTQQGADGLRSFYRSQKYVNGVATGEFTGQEIPEVTTQPITHRIAIGTKPYINYLGPPIVYINVPHYSEPGMRLKTFYQAWTAPIEATKTYRITQVQPSFSSTVGLHNIENNTTLEIGTIDHNNREMIVSGSTLKNALYPHGFGNIGAYTRTESDNSLPDYLTFEIWEV